MKKSIVATACVLFALSGSAWAQDSNNASPGTCGSGTTSGCTQTDPNAPSDTNLPSDTDINTNSGTGTNGTAPDDQPTGASPVNPATNPSGSDSSGSSSSGSGN